MLQTVKMFSPTIIFTALDDDLNFPICSKISYFPNKWVRQHKRTHLSTAHSSNVNLIITKLHISQPLSSFYAWSEETSKSIKDATRESLFLLISSDIYITTHRNQMTTLLSLTYTAFRKHILFPPTPYNHQKSSILITEAIQANHTILCGHKSSHHIHTHTHNETNDKG